MSGIELPLESNIDCPSYDFFDKGRITTSWHAQQRFVILETGFGSGCHFLTTWMAWREDPARPQQLHYVAIEPHPHCAADLKKLHTSWPGLQSLSDALCTFWPPIVPGFHRVFLEQGSITLTLIFDEIPHALQQLDARIDAFFLPIFSTENQAGHWEKKIFSRLAALAADQATLTMGATSNSVRANLEATGFHCENHSSIYHRTNILNASFSPRRKSFIHRSLSVTRREAIVIGAGLAGTAACERLAARAWKVTLIERHAQPAQETSGNLTGIFMPVISKDDNPTSRLTRAAYLFALQAWKNIGGIGIAFAGDGCGALQLARDEQHAHLQQTIAQARRYPADFAQWHEASAASVLLGVTTTTGGWLFPQGGWANPQEICEAMLAACAEQCEVHTKHSVAKLVPTKNGWEVCNPQGSVIAEAPVVIFANGNATTQLPQTADLPLVAVRGQVSHFPSHLVPHLPLVVCGEAYLTQSMQGICGVGATYDLHDDPALRQASQDDNVRRIGQLLPDLAQQLANAPLAGRVGFRAVSPDRLPLVGALPDIAAMHSFQGDRLKDVPRLPGLYGLLGYASRGLIWAPLAAELLACQLTGEPLPVETSLVNAIDPARFALKAHRRR